MPTIFLMLGCACSIALTSLIFKVFSIEDEFWSTAFWMFAGEALPGLGILLVPAYRRQFLRLFRRHRVAVAAFNTANELINLGGGLAARYALVLGPLSLVQAIGRTPPLFVFSVGVALTRFSPRLGLEELTARSLMRKGAPFLPVVVGVALIAT